MKLYKHIPNALTCGNLLCGCLALLMMEDFRMVALWVLLGLGFDFADGLAARLLKAQSALGKQLDSLADMVTFGVVPGLLVFYILMKILIIGIVSYIALLIPVAAALRLAKFNIDTRQSKNFRGLPTPAAALFFISWVSFVEEPIFTVWFSNQAWLPISFILLIAGLMVADIPLISLKFEDWTWQKNFIRYIFLMGAGLILIYWQFLGVPILIALYILLSLIYFGLGKKV